ncbi:MAG TPA: carbohydrate kinase family protein [Candidatus Paceibacterota bacterium]|nr:carbohydrate kinase family protein [Candidatus Paceibacterota bacterium]
MNKPVDFLAIGDLVTDAFIRLKDAHVSCNLKKDTCELCMRFGDKIPFEFAKEVKAVGNSANAAVSAARLGLVSGLISNIGDDVHGKEAMAELLKNGVSTKYVKSHTGKNTNYHYVLWFESERTILIKHEAFEYVWPNIIDTPKWLYVSSLAANTENYHDEIIAYAESHPDMKVAFQPGTFQIKLGIKRLKKLYERTSVFVCNVEEAHILLTDYTPKDAEKIAGATVKELLSMMKDVGPDIVLITDGPKGAYAFDGKQTLFQPPYPDVKPPLERTGAGDSFASTFVVALAKGLPMETALSWAPINSMSVVQCVGAQEGLLSQKKLTEYLSAAPSNYKVTEI